MRGRTLFHPEKYVGHFTEIYFPMKNVRYIAVNDCVDTANKNNDIAALKNGTVSASLFAFLCFRCPPVPCRPLIAYSTMRFLKCPFIPSPFSLFCPHCILYLLLSQRCGEKISSSLKVGHFTEIYFPMKNVRYIAVNDCVDTANKNNDIAALKFKPLQPSST